MGSITFGTIFLLIVLLPGVLYRGTYYFQPFSRSTNRSRTYEDITGVILSTIFIHIVSYIVFYSFFRETLAFSRILEVIQNTMRLMFDPEYKIEQYFRLVFTPFLIYNLIIWLFAILAALFINYSIRLWNWDIKYKWFRFGNHWYYYSSGNTEYLVPHSIRNSYSFTYVTAVVDSPNGGYIYAGILKDYIFNKDGQIESLTLSKCTRRRQSSSDLIKYKPKAVNVDLLVLKCRYLTTYGFYYLKFKDKEELDEFVESTGL